MTTLLDNPERLKRLVRLEYERGIASADLAQRKLREFVHQGWHVVEPATPYIHGWHIDAICDHLQAVSEGHIKLLLINMPPRHMKSLCVSVFWPMWEWTYAPHVRWMFSSYALSLAIRDSLKCRRLVESDWYQRYWGHVFSLSKDQNGKQRFENSKRGYRLAVSVGSAATGEGGDRIICDDPHNVIEAESEVIREGTLDWWDTTMSSRLNNPKTGAKVIVMQRVHQYDLSGHVLEQGGYVHLRLPAEYEPESKCFTDIGWEDPRKEEGELLWTERFTKEALDSIKRSLGSVGYAGQYLQRPVPAGGAIFKKQWFRYFTETPDAYLLETTQGVRSILKSDCWRFTVVDLAISSKQTADYTVIQTYDVTPQNDLLLIEQIRDHLDNPQQQKILRLLYHRLKPRFLKVESVGYQLALIQELRNEPHNRTDFLVQAANPDALDKTLWNIPGVDAFLVREDLQFDKYVVVNGCYVARVLCNVDYFRFVVEKQGYCKIVGRPGQDTSKVSIPVREYKPVKDKVARATTPAIWMENGKFFFRQGDPYLATVEPELLTFPLGGHDDIVDDCSMAADEVSAGISVASLMADLENRQSVKTAIKDKVQQQRNEWFW